jgi:hypothetical protein
VKIAAQQWSNTERAKETGTHAGAVNHFRAGCGAHYVPALVIDIERLKNSVKLLPVEIVRI